MALQVRFVQELNQIVGPVADYLNHDIELLDLFEQQHVIVPTAGVRAWLVTQLARRLGAANGRGDGIVSNVRFGYVGALNAFLRNGVEDNHDSWSIDHLTMAVLHVVSNDITYEWLVKKYGGRLRAARAIADRFDRYAARRPHMIRAWERGRMMIPGVNVADPAEVERFRWQFELWTKVREVVGVPSWPARSEELIAQLSTGVSIPGMPRRLMVAGLESISASNLEVLIALGHVIDIDALFVHPSPTLREEWAQHESTYRTETGDIPKRDEEFFTQDVDVLTATWTRGSFELQMLLASQGISPVHIEVGSEVTEQKPASSSNSLLSTMQSKIAQPRQIDNGASAAGDVSVQIHRTHNLARQVDVLQDALLHAFTDIPDLQPHEVLVLCADIESAAPLLQAAFDRNVSLSGDRTVKIPFVVADRSLRDVSAGAELLDDILNLAQSRFDLNSVMKVATASLVLNNFGLDDSAVAAWMRIANLTRVRWGLDTEQRGVKGLDAPSISAHSWQHMLERALLGALVPNGPAAIEMGDVVPLTHIDVADIVPIGGLVGILSPLVALELATRSALSVGDWCDVLEGTLVQLCGESCVGIDDALDVLSQFRRSTSLQRDDEQLHFVDPVNFDEFAELIAHLITTVPGRQPLRTGAITATSFVPLRAVPFRVVCVVGLDDGTLPNSDTEGDDLVAVEALMGDADPRLETRRVLLDAVLVAQERLIVTCIGRSIKNNSPVPLVTPLAELVDFCVRLGVAEPSEPSLLSGIEYLHPRHPSGERNFVNGDDAVIPGLVWSHDVAAKVAAEKLNDIVDSPPAAVTSLAEPTTVMTLKVLEDLVLDPLEYYLERTLKIYDDYGKVDDSATLPVVAEKFGVSNAAEALDGMLDAGSFDEVGAQWRTAMRSTEILPVEPFVNECLDEAKKIALNIHAARLAANLIDFRAEDVQLHVGGGFILEGQIDGICDAADAVSVVRYSKYWEKDRTRIAIRLLVLCAMGNPIRKGVIVHCTDTGNSATRTVTLDPSITQETATKALRALLESERIARTIPCPLFDDTAEKLFADSATDDEVADAFERATDAYGFKDSKECLVFGSNPTVHEVYETRKDLLQKFFDAFFGLMRVNSVEGDKNGWVVVQ